MKALIGKQKNLNEGLKKAILESPAKIMGRSPLKQDDLKMMETKGDAIDPATGEAIPTITTKTGEGSSSTPKGNVAANKPKSSSSKGKIAYGGTKTYAEGSKAAKASTGMTLNQLVAKRGKTKKGSNEYNAIQNQINKALGSKKVHSVKGTAKINGTTIKQKPSGKTVVKNQTDDGKSKVITTSDGKRKSVTTTGKSTDTKADDKKIKSVTKSDGSNRTVTVTSQTRNVKKTDAEGNVTKNRTRKRIGQGRIKGAIKKAVENRKTRREDRKAKREEKKADSPAKMAMKKSPAKVKGGKMPMAKDPKSGKMVPAFAVDGKGKNDSAAKMKMEKSPAKMAMKKSTSPRKTATTKPTRKTAITKSPKKTAITKSPSKMAMKKTPAKMGRAGKKMKK